MLTVVLEIFLLIIILAGVILLPFGVPGNFIGALIILLYGLFEKGNTFEFWHFLLFLGLAILCEIIDYFSGIWGSKKFGASKNITFIAIVGMILGAILGSMILSVFGTILGLFIGLFAGVFIWERYIVKRSIKNSLKAAYGAILGRTFAIFFKYFIGIVMIIFIIVRFW